MSKKTNLKILKKISMQVRKRSMVQFIEKKLDEAIDEGNFDKIFECEFLRKRL